MTRAAPARLLGLPDRGHLGAGAVADIAVYADDADMAKMFRARRARVQGRRTRRARRRGDALPLGPRACRGARATIGRSSGACSDYYDERYGLSADFMAVPEQRRSAGRSRSRRCHARADRQRHTDRRHVRRSLRHARDRDRHHRRQRALGAPGGGHDDRLRHLGDRLRLRGGHRERAVAARRRRTAGPACACCCSRSRPANCRSSCRTASANAC